MEREQSSETMGIKEKIHKHAQSQELIQTEVYDVPRAAFLPVKTKFLPVSRSRATRIFGVLHSGAAPWGHRTRHRTKSECAAPNQSCSPIFVRGEAHQERRKRVKS